MPYTQASYDKQTHHLCLLYLHITQKLVLEFNIDFYKFQVDIRFPKENQQN